MFWVILSTIKMSWWINWTYMNFTYSTIRSSLLICLKAAREVWKLFRHHCTRPSSVSLCLVEFVKFFATEHITYTNSQAWSGALLWAGVFGVWYDDVHRGKCSSVYFRGQVWTCMCNLMQVGLMGGELHWWQNRGGGGWLVVGSRENLSSLMSEINCVAGRNWCNQTECRTPKL